MDIKRMIDEVKEGKDPGDVMSEAKMGTKPAKIKKLCFDAKDLKQLSIVKEHLFKFLKSEVENDYDDVVIYDAGEKVLVKNYAVLVEFEFMVDVDGKKINSFVKLEDYASKACRTARANFVTIDYSVNENSVFFTIGKR